MDKRVLLTVFVAVGLALGVALLAFGVFMWMNRFPWTSVLPGSRVVRCLDVVVSAPAQMTNEPVAPTSDPGTQGTPPAEVSD